MMPLPEIMVAPNGARRTKNDHPALPINIEDTVSTARACFENGADGIHAHVRDAAGRHVLDVGLYRELIDELGRQVPQLAVQVTTEAVGMYSASEQRAMVKSLMPKSVSVALSEMLSDDNMQAAKLFYHFSVEHEIAVQHILYSPEHFETYVTLIAKGVIPSSSNQILFVLGRYVVDQQSQPEDLEPFLEILSQQDKEFDWAVCAFGVQETNCLLAAYRAGGKVRVGFENNLFNTDGRLAKDNAERVSEIVSQIQESQ